MIDASNNESAAGAARVQRDWTLLTAQTFLFGFGFAVYSGVFQNFLRDVIHATPFNLGTLESVREIPGLLTAITGATLVALAEKRVAAIGLGVTAFGIGVTGFAPGFSTLVAITVMWSIGFHLYSSMSPALTIGLAQGRESGRHLGRMASVGAGATLSALALSWLLARSLSHLPYHAFFLTAGIAILGGSICTALMSTPVVHVPRERLILRREYALIYLLTFLEGCRRQIFSIFASFALILVYRVPLSAMLLLQLVNAVMISVASPWIGKRIDHTGERGPLAFYAVGLIVVFLGYATIPNVYALYALFLLDNVLFSFGVGITTYLHRIVRKGELTPCLSMGTTMNHVAAVAVPISGAWLWQHYHNYQIPFWVGVGVAVVSLVANQWLPRGPHDPAHLETATAPASEEALPVQRS